MISWVGENFASIVLLLVVAAIVIFLIRIMIKERSALCLHLDYHSGGQFHVLHSPADPFHHG